MPASFAIFSIRSALFTLSSPYCAMESLCDGILERRLTAQWVYTIANSPCQWVSRRFVGQEPRFFGLLQRPAMTSARNTLPMHVVSSDPPRIGSCKHKLVHRRKGAIAASHEAAMAGGPHRSEGLDEIAQDATFHGADLEASILMTN